MLVRLDVTSVHDHRIAEVCFTLNILTFRHRASRYLEEEERSVLFLLFDECFGDIHLHRRRYQRHHQAYDRAITAAKKHGKQDV